MTVAGKVAEVTVGVHPLAVGLGVVVLEVLEVLEVRKVPLAVGLSALSESLARLVFVLVVSEVHLVAAVEVSVSVWMLCM